MSPVTTLVVLGSLLAGFTTGMFTAILFALLIQAKAEGDWFYVFLISGWGSAIVCAVAIAANQIIKAIHDNQSAT